MSQPSPARRAVRLRERNLQKELDQLARMAHQSVMTLGGAVDRLSERVKALEDALEAARSKSNGSKLLVLP